MGKEAAYSDQQLARLEDIRLSGLYLQDGLSGTDAAAVLAVQKQFEDLADMFYNEFTDDMTPRQYQTARADYEYFMVLLERIRQHYLSLADKKGG
jgi:hypothetical protein